MPFVYVIPVYNEEAQVRPLVEKLRPLFAQNPGSGILIVDNGSTDRTWTELELLTRENPVEVRALRLLQKGQGRAFRAGMQALAAEGLPTDTWIVFSAADLPFGFSDVQQVGDADLYIGSKAHPESQAPRGLTRTVMSFGYRLIRYVLLGMRTKDPQGSLIFKTKWLRLHAKCDADDYFFSTQFVYFVEDEGARVVEVPIQMKPDFRPSRVKPLQDGWRVFRQILRFARVHGRVKGRA